MTKQFYEQYLKQNPVKYFAKYGSKTPEELALGITPELPKEEAIKAVITPLTSIEPTFSQPIEEVKPEVVQDVQEVKKPSPKRGRKIQE